MAGKYAPCVVWVSAVAFGVAWWLGLYLLARDPRKAVLRRAGVALLAYAAAVVADRLAGTAPWFDGVRIVLVCLPVLAWSGVFVRLLPGPYVARIDHWWRVALLPLCALLAMPAAGGFLPAGYVLGAVTLLALLGTMLGVLGRHADWCEDARQSAATLITVGSLLLGLAVALILLGLNVLPSTAMLSGLAIPGGLLGAGIAILDAFDEGEALRPDMFRALIAAVLTTVVFGGQAAVAILLTGERTASVALLYAAIATAIALQALNVPFQAGVDRLTLATPLRRRRAELRSATESLPRNAIESQPRETTESAPDTEAGVPEDDTAFRRDCATRIIDLDEDDLARLTRRALGNYADLGRLVSSPLLDLPVVDARLAARGGTLTPLDRATALKALLAESITRLKPRAETDFDTGEEWQLYNAAYYSYVVGLRPYSGRTRRARLDPQSRRALTWFTDQVPRRTMRDWQHAAARLIADDLRSDLDRIAS